MKALFSFSGMQAIIHNILQHKTESHDSGSFRFNHLRGKRQYQQRIMNGKYLKQTFY